VVKRLHNHPPNPDRVSVRRVRTALRTRAAEENTALPVIYREETARIANNHAAAAMMPPYNDVSTSMHRDRLAQYPPLPRSRTNLIIPGRFQTTLSDQQFLLSTG
jgi:hypothetical protein